MATFIGLVEGNRGPATRVGSKQSGLKVAAQSWHGSVIVNLFYNDDELMVEIGSSNGSSSTMNYSNPTFCGTFDEFKQLLSRKD